VTFARRVVVLSAAAVATAVALASVVVYLVVRGELRGQVDDGLRTFGDRVSAVGRGEVGIAGLPPGLPPGAIVRQRFQLPVDPLNGPIGTAQVVTAAGDVVRPSIGNVEAPVLPYDKRTLAVARGDRGAYFTDATVDETHVRVLTTPTGVGALQLVRPLTEVDDTLGRLRLILLLVTVGGVGGAAGLGLVVSRNALRPVLELTEAAEHVAATQDLDKRMPAGERDELDRLGASFNTMLAALGSSREAQRRLVADASHELRTPLTSIRTNVELLARSPDLDPAERASVLRAATLQLEELSVLVGDLVDLARSDEPGEDEQEHLRLDLLVGDAVARARRLVPECRVELEAEPCTVTGARARLHRAVANLLDNAVKHGPREGPVEVTVRDGVVTVRDHGPGIAADDLPHVFDRFYRAPSARGLPGSGLGLAIVRQAAQADGGTVRAEAESAGGTRFVLTLPLADPGVHEPPI
jgi:two-component system sensor histidine kinase MprB